MHRTKQRKEELLLFVVLQLILKNSKLNSFYSYMQIEYSILQLALLPFSGDWRGRREEHLLRWAP
jgi:hypothetical protein